MIAAVVDPEAFEAIRGTFEPLVHHDFETVTVPGQIPLGGPDAENPSQPTFYGLDGFASSFRDWLSAWESWVVTPTEFIDVDEDRVLVMIEIRARSKTHQVEMPIKGANLHTLRDRKLARVELFFDQANALEAAGLRE